MSLELCDSFESPLIHSLKYDYQTCRLYVYFHIAKPIIYQNVPSETWVDFKESDSVDNFYHESIKDDFDAL
ncbi:MAG: KTSC domain-containing protein [Deltaproteobacteria bacterium]|jgi:hypothetical protein|nr:KTSC domain-containing protein [Deltaproteobacteria bacterium]